MSGCGLQAIVETCLAMTIFREDFTVSFITMFVLLSFAKVCHWLVQVGAAAASQRRPSRVCPTCVRPRAGGAEVCLTRHRTAPPSPHPLTRPPTRALPPPVLQDRVDFMETAPDVSRLAHARIVAFMALLLVGGWPRTPAPGNFLSFGRTSEGRAAKGTQLGHSPGAAAPQPWMLLGLPRLSHPQASAPGPHVPYPPPPTPLPPSHPPKQGIDIAFLHFTLSKTVQHGVSVHLLFAFEYAVLASTITTTAIKYCL